jgi:hypothetical protein
VPPATAGDVSTSAIEAKSEVTDAAEYEAGAAVAGASPTGGSAAASGGSRARANEGSGNRKSGAGFDRDKLKFDFGGVAGEARGNLTGVESRDAANEGTDGSKDLSRGGTAKAGSPWSGAFRHAVDVPQFSQWRRMFPLME